MRKIGLGGFTLIEFMIVFLLLIVLLGYIIPNFNGIFDEKKITQAESDVELLKITIDNYYRNSHNYPVFLGDLTLAQPRILEVLPEDPYQTNNKNYGYSLVVPVPDVTYYVVYSWGPNGITEWQYSGGEVFKRSGDDIVASNLPVLR